MLSNVCGNPSDQCRRQKLRLRVFSARQPHEKTLEGFLQHRWKHHGIWVRIDHDRSDLGQVTRESTVKSEEINFWPNSYGGFHKWGYPQIIKSSIFHGILAYKPSIYFGVAPLKENPIWIHMATSQAWEPTEASTCCLGAYRDSFRRPGGVRSAVAADALGMVYVDLYPQKWWWFADGEWWR